MVSLVVQKNRAGKWYWNLQAENGKIWATSESYASRSNALRAGNKFVKELDKIVITVRGE